MRRRRWGRGRSAMGSRRLERARDSAHRRAPACARSDFRAVLYNLAAVREILAARLPGPVVVLFDGCAGGGGGVADQPWGRVGSSGLATARIGGHRRVLALTFGLYFIIWRRSGKSWPRACPARWLFFLTDAPAAVGAWPISHGVA